MSTKTTYTFQDRSVLGNRREDDGVTHINIHSRGKTDLGVRLSHFSHTPFTHPYFGPFYSMEGLWFYLRAGHGSTEVDQSREKLRYLSGFRAKTLGKQMPYVWYDKFKDDIIAANYQKIIQTAGLVDAMVESTLPFDHYYTFGEKDVHVTPNNFNWLCAGFEDIRTALKAGEVPACWVEAEKRYLPS